MQSALPRTGASVSPGRSTQWPPRSAREAQQSVHDDRQRETAPPSQNGGSIQVPASPVRKTQAPRENPREREDKLPRHDRHGKRHFKVTKPMNTSHSVARAHAPASRPQSFSERLASVRADEGEHAKRQKRIEKSRVKAFGLSEQEMSEYKSRAVDIPEEVALAPVFNRNEVLSEEGPHGSTTADSQNPRKRKHATDANGGAQDSSQAEDLGGFESYSSIHLSRRILPHGALARQVSGKKIMTIMDTLREIKAPDFCLPDVEQDVVIIGIVAKKSEPRTQKAYGANGKQKEGDGSKYMVISLCDLTYSVDLFLFGSGFERFWKITEGSVVAIVNPDIMPPRAGADSGRQDFAFVINSSYDCILEIGVARDLGYCKSVKKNGEPCHAWVNLRRTHYCEFHTNEAVQKTRASRLEVNTGGGFGEGPKKGKGRSGPARDGGFFKKHRNENYDWESRTQWFSTRTMSATDLIDGKDRTEEDKKERSAHLKRSLEAKEKEREIMKRLGKRGDGAGKEYMKLVASKARNGMKADLSSSREKADNDDKARYKETLESLNLKGRNRNILLGPAKKGQSSSSATGPPSTLGWGGGLKDKLARMKQGEKLRKETQTRPQVPVDLEEEDELVILK